MFDDRVLYPFFDSEIHWWRYINNVADVETFNRNWLKGTCAMCRKLVHLEVKTCGYGSNFGTPEIDGQEISYQRPNLEVPCTQNLKSPPPWVFTQTHVKSAFSQFMNWSQDPCLVLGADWSWRNGLQLSCHPFTPIWTVYFSICRAPSLSEPPYSPPTSILLFVEAKYPPAIKHGNRKFQLIDIPIKTWTTSTYAGFFWHHTVTFDCPGLGHNMFLAFHMPTASTRWLPLEATCDLVILRVCAVYWCLLPIGPIGP